MNVQLLGFALTCLRSFHVAYRVKVADLKMVSYTYDELVGTSSRPSMDLNEEWDGTERPATLLVIRLLSGHCEYQCKS